MKILLSLVTRLWYVNPYLLCVLPMVLFIVPGKKMRIMYCIISTYDMITSLDMKLGLYLHVTLWSFPYLRCYLCEFINNQTHSVGKTGGDTSPYSFSPPLSFRLIVTTFENFEYSWDAQASTLLLLCLPNGFQILFRVKQTLQNIVQNPAPGLDSYE